MRRIPGKLMPLGIRAEAVAALSKFAQWGNALTEGYNAASCHSDEYTIMPEDVLPPISVTFPNQKHRRR